MPPEPSAAEPAPSASEANPPVSLSPTPLMLAALALASVSGSLNVVVLGPFLPAISDDLDAGIPLLGQAPALANLVAAFLGLLIGPLADRYGQRRALVLGLLALTGSSLVIALAPAYLLFLAGVMLGSPARSIAVPVAQAIAGSAFVDLARARAVGWTQAGGGAAVTIGLPLLTLLASLTSWRAALLAFAGVSLLAALLAGIGLPDHEREARPALHPREVLAAYRPLLRDRLTLGLIGSTILGNSAISMVLTYVGAFLVEVHGLTAREVGWAFSVSGLTLIVGGIAGTRVTRYVHASTLVVLLMLLRGGVMAGVYLLPFGHWGSVAAFTVLGFCDGVYLVAVVLTLTAETSAGRATTMVANGSAVSLGNAIGSGLGGLLLALGGYGLLGVWPPVATTCAALLVWRTRAGRS